jgi:hypothetical protein
MELTITEIDDIPENYIQPQEKQPYQPQQQYQKPMNQSIPKPYAKMVRPRVPEQKPKISYDDILNKMGMFVSDGKLHLVDNLNPDQLNQINQTNQTKQLNQTKQINQTKQLNQTKQIIYKEEPVQTGIPQNSYIYNKYFSNEKPEEPSVRVPRNVYEYRNMLIQDIIQKQKIRQMKSTKLILPNTNMNFSAGNSPANLNKLFSFSNR